MGWSHAAPQRECISWSCVAGTKTITAFALRFTAVAYAHGASHGGFWHPR